MLELIGEKKASAVQDGETILRIESALAKGSLTRVERRNPYNLYHKMTPAALQALTPSFDWSRYLADNQLSQISTLNITGPNFFQASIRR